MAENNENLHKRHRQNMKEVYYKSGLESLPDHTVFELLLYFGIPMKDTNEIAHRLLEKFGSFSAVLQADMSELRSVPGMTENAACLISMLLPMFRRYQDDLNNKNVIITSAEDIVAFIKPKFIDAVDERLFAIFLAPSGKVISSRQICEGDLSSVNFSLRNLVSACLETKAKSIVLVHNHPSGISVPSLEDIEMTKNVSAFLKAINVDLADHVILSQNDYTSMCSVPKFSPIFR